MINITDVTYRYKGSDRDVLKQVSASFDAGKVYAILGPSGSGKTTLLSILAGLDRPLSGDVYIGDKSLKELDLDMYRRQMVGIVFQSFQLFPLLTALENVTFVMQANGVPAKEAKITAAANLEQVGITADKHGRYPANLSGGEQQRVAIARALSTGAKIIIADEPTGNLDTENGDAVIGILSALAHEQGLCVIIVTHNLDIAAVSDFVYRMSDGVLRAE